MKGFDEIKEFMQSNMRNCPFCESEIKGSSGGWGFSPEGWVSMEAEHNAYHKKGIKGVNDT